MTKVRNFALLLAAAVSLSAQPRYERTVRMPAGAAEASRGQAAVLGPYSVAVNYPADITGSPDPEFWGYAGEQVDPVTFEVPAGYRVRVLRLEGNYMAWARGVYAPGNHAGTSWGITTTAPGGSSRVSVAADNCFAYLEYALSNGEVNQPFSIDTRSGGLLQPDNTMNVVLAVYLSDQQIPIHMETTFTMTFQFEQVP